jgi:hypothetical protein
MQMAKKVLFVEQRPDHKYNVTAKGNSKPLAITKTQADAIKKAQKIDPDAALHVERVRDIGPAATSGVKSENGSAGVRPS